MQTPSVSRNESVAKIIEQHKKFHDAYVTNSIKMMKTLASIFISDAQARGYNFRIEDINSEGDGVTLRESEDKELSVILCSEGIRVNRKLNAEIFKWDLLSKEGYSKVFKHISERYAFVYLMCQLNKEKVPFTCEGKKLTFASGHQVDSDFSFSVRGTNIGIIENLCELVDVLKLENNPSISCGDTIRVGNQEYTIKITSGTYVIGKCENRAKVFSMKDYNGKSFVIDGEECPVTPFT